MKQVLQDIKDRLAAVFSKSIVDLYTSFDPTLREEWIRISLIPSESNNITTGKDSIIEVNGLMQIDLFTPQNTDINLDLVKTIVDHLNSKRQLASFQIDRVWRGVDAPEPDWIRTPIFVRFRKFVGNVGIND